MWPYYPDLLARPIPRYTSYPTAAEFNDMIGSRELGAAFDTITADQPLSLYLHIPFCREICWYCGCNTGAANREARVSAYLDALENEIDLVAGWIGSRGRVQRIAFGGGSPNAITPLRFVRLIDRLVTRFDVPRVDLSVELDPRTLTPEWIAVLGAIGVDRVSLGVQTFAPHVQQAIGRIQPTEMIITAVDSLRAAGVGSVNFDLMYGLPGQSLEDLADTLTTALDIRPDRISLFGYAHLPAMLPRQRRIDSASLPDGRLRFDQAALGYQRLTDTGYRPVGFDHFARPDDPLALAARQGRLRRNFQGFTDDEGDTLIGLGASAISQFPDLLAQNEKMAGRYRMIVNAEQLSARRGVVRTAEDRRRGTAIERFLCDGQAMLDDDLFAQAGAGLAKFVERGLVTLQKGMICLGDGGLPYARAIASRLDAYRMESSGRFSHAV